MSRETDDAELLFQKINKLMSLVDSPNEHEARNAAWQAVKLIKVHKLLGLTIDGYSYALIDGRMHILKKEKSTQQAPPGWVQVMGDAADIADTLERAINGPRRQTRKSRNSPFRKPT